MTREISLAGNPIEVEVASNDAKRYKGLSGREKLGKDEGMLFVWPMEKEHGLVMRDMNFGLDMVFADSNGEVTKVHSADPNGERTTAFSKYAVELPKGYCEVAGVEKGDRLELDAGGLGKSDRDTEEILDYVSDAVEKAIDESGVSEENTKTEVMKVIDTETISTALEKAFDELTKEWIPYVGPDDGEGWQNANDPNDVRYQTDPPGEAYGEYGQDYWERHEGERYTSGQPLTEYREDIPEATVTEGNPEDFSNSVAKFQEEKPEKGAFLSHHPAEEMQDHTIMQIDEEGVEAGAAVSPEGDLQNIHKFEGPKGIARNLIEEGIDQGGRTGDCYSGFLNRVYRQHGLREVARQEFNEEFAPDDWNYDKYGKPDVVFMAYMPNKEPEKTDNYIDDWGEAKELCRQKANWEDRMSDEETEEKQSEIRIPENEEAVLDMVAGEDGELTDQEKNVAIAQAKIIGDI